MILHLNDTCNSSSLLGYGAIRSGLVIRPYLIGHYLAGHVFWIQIIPETDEPRVNMRNRDFWPWNFRSDKTQATHNHNPYIFYTLYADGTHKDCKKAAGLENRQITDSQLSASSFSMGQHPSRGRLNNHVKQVNGSTLWDSWCAGAEDKSQYLQVLFKIDEVHGGARNWMPA